MILECKVYCVDSKLEEMGIDTTYWLDFAIDLRDVHAVKVTGVQIGEFNERGILYCCGDAFVTDLQYEEVLEKWKRSKSINEGVAI